MNIAAENVARMDQYIAHIKKMIPAWIVLNAKSP